MATDIRALLKHHFGFADFRPGQRQVIEKLLTGRSAAAVFPTGSGKSLCYQLPALAFAGTDAGGVATDRFDERSDRRANGTWHSRTALGFDARL